MKQTVKPTITEVKVGNEKGYMAVGTCHCSA